MSEDAIRWFFIELLCGVAGLAVLIWCISFAIRSANETSEDRRRRGGLSGWWASTFGNPDPPPLRRESPPPVPPANAPGGFPVRVAEPAPVNDGPGTFEVSGVDKESGMDVTEYINASSPANARVKAELKGVVVTKVERTK